MREGTGASACGAIMRALLILIALAFTGCASLPELSKTEIAWQSLHAIDAVQTYRASRDPCFEEGTALTEALIGDNPSAEAVVGWYVGTAFAHYAVSSWLEDRAPRLHTLWQFVTIADVGYAVGNNHSIGIRIGSHNKTPSGCVR